MNKLSRYCSVVLSKYWIDKCRKFSIDAVESSRDLYTYRGTTNINKIIEDIYIGKAGEVGAYKYLLQQGVVCSKPDFKIYDARRKSFDADLNIPDMGVHVKSQGMDSAEKFGNSWLFQRTDPVYLKPNYDLFLGTLVDGNTVYIIKECLINELDFQDCKVFWFNKTKVAVYA